MELTPIFVLLIILGSLYAILHLYVRKKERMALLEKGVDASKLIFPKRTTVAPLKYGLLLIGLAVGLLLGDVLSCTTELQEEVSYFSMVFIFGGLALVIFHFIDMKKQKDKGDAD
jgi:hypothetical protein